MDNHSAYTEATGDEYWDVSINIAKSLDDLYFDSKKLAKLRQASVMKHPSGRGPDRLLIKVRLDGLVDVEHDAASLFYMEVGLPTTVFEHVHREVHCVLLDLRAYPLDGIPPGEPDEDDSSITYMDYLPPRRPEYNALAGQFVSIEYGPTGTLR